MQGPLEEYQSVQESDSPPAQRDVRESRGCQDNVKGSDVVPERRPR